MIDCGYSGVRRLRRYDARYGELSAVSKCNQAFGREQYTGANDAHRNGELFVRFRIFGQIALHPTSLPIFVQGESE